MIQASSDYFTAVQEQLGRKGLTVILSADERDVVDDYEGQEFSVEACAEHIAKSRA